ncbi:MAG: serine/threonine protein kinase, partial [Planctomycetota bacterium]
MDAGQRRRKEILAWTPLRAKRLRAARGRGSARCFGLPAARGKRDGYARRCRGAWTRGPAREAGLARRIGGYDIVRELSRGAMGIVYEAEDPRLHRRRVALKVIAGDLERRPDLQARFRREAQSVARLDHEGIVRIHQLGVDRGRAFIVMDLVEGESLHERVVRGGPLAADEAARVFEKLARAVAHAHARGVLHRDIKPANILLGEGGARPVLADFGLARDLLDLRRERLTQTGEAVGTYPFMAPEQARGAHDLVDARADVYGLGAALYAALTGRQPFDGPTPADIARRVVAEEPVPPSALRPLPLALEAVCLKCLAKRREDRYPSAEALAEDLRRFLEGEPVGAAPTRPSARGLALIAAPLLACGLLALAAWTALSPVDADGSRRLANGGAGSVASEAAHPTPADTASDGATASTPAEAPQAR